jgi:hypothetical protein
VVLAATHGLVEDVDGEHDGFVLSLHVFLGDLDHAPDPVVVLDVSRQSYASRHGCRDACGGGKKWKKMGCERKWQWVTC